MTRNFFASLRRFFALNADKVSAGAVVTDAIDREYIPALKRLIINEENPDEKEQLEEALKLWEDAASSDRKWNEAAALAVGGQVEGSAGFSAQTAEEIAQDITVGFYSKPGWRKWLRNFTILMVVLRI